MLEAVLLAAVLAAPQVPVQFDATLGEERIGVGETTVLTITITTRGALPEQLRIPPLPAGLIVAGTSDFTETRMGVPGGRSRTLRREIVILARERGVYRIPPATVRVLGTTYSTQPLVLSVSGPSASIGDPGSLGGAAATTTLTMRLTPDTVYVGEQVVMQAEVTFAEHMRTRYSRPPAFDPPAPTGFWVQELPDPVTVALRVREGRSVESQTFRRAYFPLTAGEFAFPPAHLHYEVRRGFLSPPESRRISSDSARLVVLPLPGDQPAGFLGAVGRLDLSASVAPARVAVGDAAVLTVELRGTGNVRSLPQPKLPALPGLETLPPTHEARVDVRADVVGGTRQFRWVLVPDAPGEYVIPPLEYGVFDPELRQYVVLRSDTLRLQAVAVVAAGQRDTVPRALRVVRGREPAAWARTPLFATLQVLPLLLVGGAVALRRRRERPPGPREHERRLRRRLAELRTQGDVVAAAALERLLAEAVECLAGGNTADPVGSLRRQGRAADADMLAELLAELQRTRYAPEDERGNVLPLFDRAEAMITALAPSRGRRRRGAAIVTLLATGAGLLAGFSGGAADSDDGFVAGVASYDAGDYAGAVSRFHTYVRAQPADPNGWYNLGLAAWQDGDTGRAAWAWMRGLRIAPRDTDLRHNLSLTAAPETVRRLLPLDRLAAGERALGAAAAWWLLILSAAVRMRRRRGAAALPAVAAVALVALGVVHAADSLRPPLVTPLREGAPIFAGPSTREAGLGRLEAGQTARLLERRDDWLLIRSDAGREAWIERAAVAGL